MKPKILFIEKIVHGGMGLSRTDLGVVFTEGVLPGETVEAVIDERSKIGGALVASPIGIVKASPMRRKAECPLFGTCGGCDWLNMAYEAQLSIKEEIFRETLSRIGHVREIGPITVVSSPELGYRRRVQFKVDFRKKKIGFFRKKSNSVIPVPRCPLLTDQLNGLLATISTNFDALGATTEELKVIACDLGDCGMEANQFSTVASFPVIDRITAIKAVIRCGQFHFPVAGNGFFQANKYMSLELGSLVANWCSGDAFLDLYGGSGFFSVFVASKFRTGTCVDHEHDHINMVRETMERNGISSVTAEKSSVVESLKRACKEKKSVDCCIVDPPRSGLDRDAASVLGELRPKTIVYVSCNAATQARDAGILIDKFGYCCEKGALIDCYPQTHHIESVLLLSRKN